MKMKTLELRSVYREGDKILMEAGIKEHQIDSWLLLEHITGITKASLFADPYKKLEEEDVLKYEELLELRSKRIPLQHLTGTQCFMGYDFQVNEHVLIPRQDTECLVEEALKVLRSGDRVLDMCTGSGCILLSLLKMGEERKNLKDLTGIGLDISDLALDVAGKNQESLYKDGKITWLQSDLFAALDRDEKMAGTFDLIVSNPPYICTREIEKLQDEVKLFDPYIALDGKEDGLFFYRAIIKESRSYLKDGGWLMFEIGYDQGKSVPELMEEAGFTEILVKKDLAGLDRVVVGMYNRG